MERRPYLLRKMWLILLPLFLLIISAGCTEGGDDDQGASDDLDIDDDADDSDSLPWQCSPENYAIQVVECALAENGGFGEEYLPDNITGPPSGRGGFAPQSSPRELLSLGDGGYVVLKLGRKVVDGEGPDLVVFENPFYCSDDEDCLFTEVAVVEVSQDGELWHRFPFDYEPTGDEPWTNPNSYTGLAGVNPVYATCSADDFIDPLDPEVSGGDLFDLADVGLKWAAYVRIVDAGNDETNPGSQIADGDGDLLDDAGNHGFSSPPTAGFDLDAVGIINGGERLEPDGM